MAEGYFKKHMGEASSAGIRALEGWGASDNAISVMKGQGVDLRGHRAQQVTGSLIADHDLILAMETYQRDELKADHPLHKDRIFTLNEYVGINDPDIEDPYGGSLSDFRESAERIKKAIDLMEEP
jgi:protein-tyrosine phosphatase